MLYKQKLALALGEEGCYFFSLLYIAEQELGRDFDSIGTFDYAMRQGWVASDCYMGNPAGMMTSLLGRRCSISKSWDFGYQLKENEWEVRCYQRVTTGTTYYHFVVVDKDGTVVYDPLGDSNTVKYGKPYSRRILTIGEAVDA